MTQRSASKKLRAGAFAAGGLLLLSLAAVVGSLSLVRSHVQNLSDEADSSRNTVTRLADAIKAISARASAGYTKQFDRLAADYLSGPQAPVILAALQNQLRTLALTRGVELNSANNLPARNEQHLEYLGLRVAFRGRLQEIQAILHEIETARPFLFVERAVLRVDSWPLKSADSGRNGAPAVIAELDVYGVRLPEPPATTAGDPSRSSRDGEAGPLPLIPPGPRKPATQGERPL